MNWSLPALLLVGCVSFRATAQDPQFTQLYANPLYHNPAFAGDTRASRAIVNYRSQWPALGANYRTAALSLDTYLPDADDRVGVGIGLQVLHDEQGDFLNTNSLAMQAALIKPLFSVNDFQIKLVGAGQFSYVSSLVNPGGLTFVDQFAGGTFRPVSLDPLAQVGVPHRQGQIGLGTLLEFDYEAGQYQYPVFWLGATLHNVGRSRERGDWTGQRLGLQAGLNIPLSGRIGNDQGRGHQMDTPQSVLRLMAYYRQQGSNQQLDMGVTWTYEPVSLGVWYRGIPFRQFNQHSQVDAVALMIGLKPESLPVWFQYSYDITVSSLRGATGGAHEISLWYNFDSFLSLGNNRRRNARQQRRCLAF